MADCAVCDTPVTTTQYVRIKPLEYDAEGRYMAVPNERHRFVGIQHSLEELVEVAEGLSGGPLRLLWYAPLTAKVGETVAHPKGITGLQEVDVASASEVASAVQKAGWPVGGN